MIEGRREKARIAIAAILVWYTAGCGNDDDGALGSTSPGDGRPDETDTIDDGVDDGVDDGGLPGATDGDGDGDADAGDTLASSGGDDDGVDCLPGSIGSCTCEPGDEGARTCDADGQWGPCECGEPLTCGNGVLDPGELCDDGNGVDADGCNATCVPSGSVQWTSGYHSPYGDAFALGVAVDGGNSIIVVGYEDRTALGSGLGTWLRRYDADGTVIWSLEPELSPLDDWAVDVATDAAGNIVVVGVVDRSAFGRGYDTWLRSYDAAGQLIWELEYDSPASDDDIAAGIAIDAADEIVIAGTETRPDLGTGRDMFVAKYDALGESLWIERIASSADDVATGVAVAPLLQIYVSGYQAESPNRAWWWLGRLETDGGLPSWIRTWQGLVPGQHIARGVAADMAGNAVVIGREDSQYQGVDARGIKYAPNGQMLGSIVYDAGLNEDEEGRAVATDVDNFIVIAGEGMMSPLSMQDAWIQKLTAAGDHVWTQAYGGATAGNDRATAIAIGSDNRIVIVGTEQTPEGNDIWVMRVEP